MNLLPALASIHYTPNLHPYDYRLESLYLTIKFLALFFSFHMHVYEYAQPPIHIHPK
jgi:hypothetical protein